VRIDFDYCVYDNSTHLLRSLGFSSRSKKDERSVESVATMEAMVVVWRVLALGRHQTEQNEIGEIHFKSRISAPLSKGRGKVSRRSFSPCQHRSCVCVCVFVCAMTTERVNNNMRQEHYHCRSSHNHGHNNVTNPVNQEGQQRLLPRPLQRSFRQVAKWESEV
jgi:hypothetical protein